MDAPGGDDEILLVAGMGTPGCEDNERSEQRDFYSTLAVYAASNLNEQTMGNNYLVDRRTIDEGHLCALEMAVKSIRMDNRVS